MHMCPTSLFSLKVVLVVHMETKMITFSKLNSGVQVFATKPCCHVNGPYKSRASSLMTYDDLLILLVQSRCCFWASTRPGASWPTCLYLSVDPHMILTYLICEKLWLLPPGEPSISDEGLGMMVLLSYIWSQAVLLWGQEIRLHLGVPVVSSFQMKPYLVNNSNNHQW